MEGVRGERMKPGEFRTSQNWIGRPGSTLKDATYVPPPIPEMNDALGKLERFIHAEDGIPPLVKCALLHYQFEAIHPFLDGNGRIGRLLITFYLCEKEYLEYPILYISDYFETYRNEYYSFLLGVSQEGMWNDWLKYFVTGVAKQAKSAEETGHRILNLQKKYRQQLQKESTSGTAFQLLDMLFSNPFVSLPGISEHLKTTWPTAKATVERMVKLGILKEVSGRKRNRVYCAHELLNLLSVE